ncbi:ComEC/Rec2 family competence protein [Roseovarius sp.]
MNGGLRFAKIRDPGFSRNALEAAWLAQRGHLFPWVPVCLAAGAGGYFALTVEPDARDYAVLGAVALLVAVGARWIEAVWMPLGWAVMLMAVGLCVAATRAHQVEGPVLGWRYYGPVEGRIVSIDRSGSDAIRLTLDRVTLRDVPPRRTPERVRIALHGQAAGITPAPGAWVMMTAHLSPPGGPVEPGGFDFQRHAWFLRLGAVGYTRTPVVGLAPPEGGLWMFKARIAMSARIQAALPGNTGAFASAIMTGDRSGIGQEALTALRVTNLAHLLAISGLHMGLLAGFVFGAFRLAFAAVPVVGLRVPAKKLSAAMALPVAAAYLGLSGGNVATERAFVMVAVALVAVMLDRRALSLRSVAVAAVIVLLLRPEALLGPGFQMSFAATTALVAGYGWLRDHDVPLGPRWMRGAVSVLVSSFVAGIATAPIAAAHFNQFAHFGLIANLLSVPLMGVMVMPAAVVAACLMPFGLEWLALWVMGLGLDWILWVAHWVAGWPGARGTVVSPGPLVLPLMAVGVLFVMLWRGWGRLAGLAPVLVSGALWLGAERPQVLIADSGALVGVMTPEGRALSREKGAGFIAQNWLENDGDAADQAAAHARWSQVMPGDIRLLAVHGRRAVDSLRDCEGHDWLVLSVEPDRALPCQVVHPGTLRETGAMALRTGRDGVRVVTAREITGARLWNSPAIRRARSGEPDQ